MTLRTVTAAFSTAAGVVAAAFAWGFAGAETVDPSSKLAVGLIAVGVVGFAPVATEWARGGEDAKRLLAALSALSSDIQRLQESVDTRLPALPPDPSGGTPPPP